MSDFLLDFRPQSRRALNRAAEQLSFAEDTRTTIIDRPGFGLVVTQTGNPTLWEPCFVDSGSLVAVAGRLAFDEADWHAAHAARGTGGLAAKAVHRLYKRDGAVALERLNGNAVVIVCDDSAHVVHLVTDYCGAFPVFELVDPAGPLYCSHPDVLADIGEERHRVDEVSLAEFILAGTVTPPFSYYERIRAADFGTVFTFALSGDDRPAPPAKRRYFEFRYRGDARIREDELADDLAAALRRAVQRRSLSLLGRAGIALSGGLDSRAILACSSGNEQTFAFCCYDQPNRELHTAEAIADSLSTRFIALRRDSDYYADHAERGVRLSGGMGSFANNHFLGVIPRLKHEGAETLLTGCYCDYLFKGLPLNRRVHRLTRRETLAPFQHQFYFDHVAASSALARRAVERWEALIPVELRNHDTSATVFEIEARRTFPLCYEGDNQQRIVPQRVIGWCPPFLDRDVVDAYCRIPYNFKFNRSIFRRVVLALAPALREIPDTNTSAALDASPISEWLRTSQLRLRRKWQRRYKPAASDESWPNWRYYVQHSPKLDVLWNRPSSDANHVFRKVLGASDALHDVQRLKRSRPFLFVGLLTVKLWLDQRAW